MLQKYSLLLKLKQHRKQLQMDTQLPVPKKLTWPDNNIKSKNRAISWNDIWNVIPHERKDLTESLKMA